MLHSAPPGETAHSSAAVPTTRRPWLLLLLSSLVVAAVLLPIAYMALRAWDAGPQAWAALWRPRTLRVLINSLLLALGSAALSTAIAVPLAWLTVAVNLPARRFWAIVSALPLAVPSYISGFAIIAVLGSNGLLLQALRPFGIEQLPSLYGYPGALLALTLVSYPYIYLGVRAALLRCDPAVEEAARSMGDAPLRVFVRILLPQLRPAIAVGALLVALYSLSDFGAVALMQFDSFTRAIYVQYRSSFDRSGAALLAWLLIALTVVLIGLESLIRGRPSMSRSNSAVPRRRRLIDIGWWRWPAMLFAALVSLAALGMPLIALCYWLLRGLANGSVLDSLWQPAANSLLAAGIAALVTVIAAIPPALLVARHPSRISRLLDAAAYSGYALPGIVVALALVFFGANLVPWIYQTLPLLIFGYLIRFVPEAIGSLRTSLQLINPRVEEAARSLGHKPWAVLTQITLPLVTPGIVAGAALVFLTVIKELPMTLLLGPTGFPTLATTIWSATTEAMFARGAAPALLLLALSALAMLLTLRHEAHEGKAG
jgi:iron(III) transport system permease protein